MNELKIRGLSSDDILKLGEQAKGQHMSRNRYLTRRLSLMAQSPELFSKEDKYEKLLNTITAEIKEGHRILEANTKVLQEVLKKL